ncbi:MAG: carbohydrate kinase family protein [Paludibacteraceae bacterium]|nr:carbohydrate kinase family protein [Paludibacteraceae bacterium]
MKIVVIGAANIDITATTTAVFLPQDSNPAHIYTAFGGVGRNMAHNLCLLGAEVSFLTIFADDVFADTLRKDCIRLGMDISLSSTQPDSRSNYYLCINDKDGEMQAAAADTELLDNLTPKWLEQRIRSINQADAVLADCNLSEQSLMYLAKNTTVPLFVDVTSVAKAKKLLPVVEQHLTSHLHLKLNRLEAQRLSGVSTVDEHIRWFLQQGVQSVYITMGADGAIGADNKQVVRLANPKVDRVVNTTGAGDAFTAAVAYGWLKGLSLRQVVEIGLIAATQTIETRMTVNEQLKI